MSKNKYREKPTSSTSLIKTFIAANTPPEMDQLSTDAQVLFEFLALIIDIKYRHEYGKTLAVQHGKGYVVSAQSEALVSQIPVIDDGLPEY